jgi:hypothetical protein
MRRKPARKLSLLRRSHNDHRRLIDNLPQRRHREALVARITYEGYGKHKMHPRAFGLEPVPGVSEDATYCDGHAGFRPEDMVRIGTLVRRGIMAGLIGDKVSQNDPGLFWTIDDNGWVYEARITLPGRAIYHGYPLLPGDAMATKIIGRLSRWIGLEEARLEIDPLVDGALRAAQELYRG